MLYSTRCSSERQPKPSGGDLVVLWLLAPAFVRQLVLLEEKLDPASQRLAAGNICEGRSPLVLYVPDFSFCSARVSQ